MSNKAGHTGSRIAKVSFLLWGSPWGSLIRLSCSGFHILPLSKLNHQHISLQRPAQKPAIPFWQAVLEMKLLEMLKPAPSSHLFGPVGHILAGPGVRPRGRQGQAANFIHVWAKASPNGPPFTFSLHCSNNFTEFFHEAGSHLIGYLRGEWLSAPPPTLKVF